MSVIATAQASAALTTAIAMQAIATAQATASASLTAGTEVNVVQPYLVVRFWKRTA